MNFMESALLSLAGVSLYTDTLALEPVRRLRSLARALEAPDGAPSQAVGAYGGLCAALFSACPAGGLREYLLEQIRQDENPFTLACAKGKYAALPAPLKQAAAYDLSALWTVGQISAAQLKQAMTDRFPAQKPLISSLPDYAGAPAPSETPWGERLDEFAAFHQKNGVGPYAQYYAFALEDGRIAPIRDFAAIPLSSLKKYEEQKKKLVHNTLAFLQGQPAHHVLLYGDRGTGKSTSVRAILSEYRDRGLRMIQISKEDISRITGVLRQVRGLPLRFILFVDDLSFEENDPKFNAFKAVLEGSLTGMPDNVLVYATTNRRHLIKESFTSREGSEVHAADTRDEAASLSDRFGLTLTYFRPTPQEYMDIVLALAADRGLSADQETIRRGASAFATRKGSRSGRVARQYVDQLESRLALGLPVN